MKTSNSMTDPKDIPDAPWIGDPDYDERIARPIIEWNIHDWVDAEIAQLLDERD